jgi:putative colanic acid biosynthesis UDP-glucose lipid carrier transferase
VVWTSVFLLLAGTVFALKNGYNISRGSSMLFVLFGFIALVVNRSMLRDLVGNIVLITDHSHGVPAYFT